MSLDDRLTEKMTEKFKIQKLTNILGKLEKKCRFCQKKNAKIRDIKMLKTTPLLLQRYAVSYYQTLNEIPWPLKLEKHKN